MLFTPTVSFLLGSDSQAYRTEGVYEKQIARREGGRLMGEVKGAGI